ncbi:RadC family protein [Candidatus Trichorickettsia mobilis]|uniref:RadC family protein n=1 Tax=Candidatus Trichorickettsia mobilis TaxID=1346319 RepID=UPI002930C18C|nr:DNA repair protein RadC [Candidatus Trichorickettsia mobilis]
MQDNQLQPHYIGHRSRLRQKVLDHQLDSFADYELLELLLFTAIPRRDVKPIAKKLLNQFGSLSGLINADKDKLLLIEEINKNFCINLYVVRELINRVLKQKIVNNNIIGCWSDLLDYLKSTMGSLKIEQFKVLFLNKKNILIADELMSVGTIDQAAVYPREIIKRALFHEAGAIILTHNHPSGSPTPSKSDLELTKKIVEVCSAVSISVHDHVIIAGGEYYSFKSNLLL